MEDVMKKANLKHGGIRLPPALWNIIDSEAKKDQSNRSVVIRRVLAKNFNLKTV